MKSKLKIQRWIKTGPWILTSLVFLCSFLAREPMAYGQSGKVWIEETESGFRLMINDKPFFINGMNWDYFPVGTNYSFNLWAQSDDFIKKALDDEMTLLRHMGVNTIRVYAGIQKKWIRYIYEEYGIYTMLNHSFGRYGMMLDGQWVAQTNYADERVKTTLLDEVNRLAREFKDTPGLLLFLLGNENNYGLFWEGAETEDFPDEDPAALEPARSLYRLFNEAALAYKSIDTLHPVAICNGDLQFLNLIREECPDIDILGINSYRGASFTNLFSRLKQEYSIPVLLTEFGSDAFNALTQQEAQCDQADIDVKNWKEIYANAAGMGRNQNCIGGFTFQFSDGWWKYKQTVDLDVHNTHSGWSNGGYSFDYIEGENNMNEEWFGICAKSRSDSSGHYQLFPRLAFYALKKAHRFNPFSEGVQTSDLDKHFVAIEKELRRSSVGQNSLKTKPLTTDSPKWEQVEQPMDTGRNEKRD